MSLIPLSPQAVYAADSGTACSVAGSCASWSIGGLASVTLGVTGTFNATLTFEASTDGQSWFSPALIKLSDGTSVTTTTTTGLFALINVGLAKFRVRVTTYASGGANLTLQYGVAATVSSSINESVISLSDVLTDNATTSKHGFLPKLGGGTTNFLRADGTYAAPPTALLQSATVTLTNAQIKVLPTTPVDVVVAPGTGKRNLFIAGTLQLDVRSGVYTNIHAGSTIFLIDADGHNVSSRIPAADWASELADNSDVWLNDLVPSFAISGSTIYSSNTYSPPSFIGNLPFRVNAANGDLGNFTGGHASNTLKCVVYYLVVDL